MSDPSQSPEWQTDTAPVRITECRIDDDKFVVPCTALNEQIDGGVAFTKARGIRVWEYYKRDGGRSRSMVGVRSKKYSLRRAVQLLPVLWCKY